MEELKYEVDESLKKLFDKWAIAIPEQYKGLMNEYGFEQAIIELKNSSQLEPLVSLPCPFCANTKIRTWQTEDEYWHIQCNSDVCGACMDDFTTEQEAIKQWNVRSN